MIFVRDQEDLKISYNLTQIKNALEIPIVVSSRKIFGRLEKKIPFSCLTLKFKHQLFRHLPATTLYIYTQDLIRRSFLLYLMV